MSFDPNPQNWTLNAYTVATWTDLIPSAASEIILKAVNVAVGSSIANVQFRLANGSGSRAVLVPASILAASTAYRLDMEALTLVTGDKLQVQVDVAGVEFLASGAQ